MVHILLELGYIKLGPAVARNFVTDYERLKYSALLT
jgi:hypothetical protein